MTWHKFVCADCRQVIRWYGQDGEAAFLGRLYATFHNQLHRGK